MRFQDVDMSEKTKESTIKIKLIRSLIGTKKSHRATVKGLGLRKINSTSILQDSAETRGMIKKVNYLLKLN